MLGKTLRLTPPTIKSFLEAELPWPPREQSSPKGPTANEGALSRASMLGAGFSATNLKLLVHGLPDKRSARQVEKPITDVWLVLKRFMDLAVSTIVLILVWPLLLLIALAIRLESSGPVIYPSLRVGEEGRNFACYKFRTMVAGSDKLKENLRALNQRRGPFFKIADDPRITHLGRFLRKYSLDELPQLWNVLKGDMSLVGPRPLPVEDCARYSSEDFQRLSVKPGITGLWQVLARANPSFEIFMMLDLAYIEKWSLPLDCKILIKTISAVLAGEGQ